MNEFYIAYGKVIDEWAFIEFVLAHIFGGITLIDNRLAEALFYSGRSFQTRRDLLTAAIEHSPAKGGFKGLAYRVKVLTGEAALEGEGGKIYQRGFHVNVLCEDCNNKTGGWYGGEFAAWSKWGLELLGATRQRPLAFRHSRAEPSAGSGTGVCKGRWLVVLGLEPPLGVDGRHAP